MCGDFVYGDCYVFGGYYFVLVFVYVVIWIEVFGGFVYDYEVYVVYVFV